MSYSSNQHHRLANQHIAAAEGKPSSYANSDLSAAQHYDIARNHRLAALGFASTFDKIDGVKRPPAPTKVAAKKISVTKAEKAPKVAPTPVVIDLTIQTSEARPRKSIPGEFTYATALCGEENRVVMGFNKGHDDLKNVAIGETVKVNAIFNQNRTITVLGLAA